MGNSVDAVSKLKRLKSNRFKPLVDIQYRLCG